MKRASTLGTVLEMFHVRNFSQAEATCRQYLAYHPHDVEVRLLLARALMAQDRDDVAVNEVSTCIRLQSRCSGAFALLGELAFRRGSLGAAVTFFREAVRLDPQDTRSKVLLDIIRAMTPPAAAAAKLPAPAAVAGISPARNR
ncbi:MAG: tetratricopeptide repeat protein [Deltaproteobacteria bacterium]|nr:tetratricopeptide repeat protein [Deltaproteobacteria bacterium]